ncbi:conserved hypothetical protein [Ricinus communis]|uniref:Uncharacterized protein n=1 Tax=Ricinus communis TaxID=3988 RepID=B9S158_RICCO|nr:conserved hypothetical protein [Ricinus communis]
MAKNDDDDTPETNDFASEINDRIARISIGIQILNHGGNELIKDIENLKKQQEDSKKNLNQLKIFHERLKECENLGLEAKIASLNKSTRDLNSAFIGSGIKVQKSGVKKKNDDHKGTSKKEASNDDLDKQEGSGVGADDTPIAGGLEEDMISLLGAADTWPE